MGFFYHPCTSPCIRQGEVIQNVVELRARYLAGTVADPSAHVTIERVNHALAIVATQDCDLDQDYKARQGSAGEDKVLAHVLLCDLFTQEDIRQRSKLTADLWKRVRQNQNERYHMLEAAQVRDSDDGFPALYADFKAIFSLPTEAMYALLGCGSLVRKGFLPSPYLEDFTHRLYHYLGRVPIREF